MRRMLLPASAQPGPRIVKPWSIRKRVSRRVLALVLLSWLATMAIATLFLRHEINEMLDEELEAVVQTTLLSLDAGANGVIARTIGIRPEGDERVLRILPPDAVPPDDPWPALTRDGLQDVAGWRVLRVSAENAVIEAAHRDAWRREETLEAASAFLLLLLPMIALLLIGLRLTLGQGFRPLEDLAGSIAARGPDDLSALPDQGLPAELKPLAEGLNSWIGRVDDLRKAERQFIANASHELRTPLAEIRARLDLSGQGEVRATLPMLDALTRRIERLLQLSRSEAGLGLERGPADLLQVTRLLIREKRVHPRRPIRFDDGDIGEFWIAADPDAVAIILRNLIENALEHGSGPVTVRLGACASVTVINPVAAADLQDPPFTRREGVAGRGLGLAIVADLAQAIGAWIEKDIRDGEARVTLWFPPCLDPQADPPF